MTGEHVAPTGVIKKSLQVIEKSVNRLRQAAQDYQRLTPEPEEPAQFGLSKFISDIVRNTTSDVKGVEVNTALGGAPIVIGARKRGLTYVFEGLLLNALKQISYADDSSAQKQLPQIRVKIEVNRENHRVQCRVSDSGAGIPENLLSKVFREPMKGRPGGTGLGMFLINRFLTDNGGSIELSQDKPDGYDGACFLISLPIDVMAGQDH